MNTRYEAGMFSILSPEPVCHAEAQTNSSQMLLNRILRAVKSFGVLRMIALSLGAAILALMAYLQDSKETVVLTQLGEVEKKLEPPSVAKSKSIDIVSRASTPANSRPLSQADIDRAERRKRLASDITLLKGLIAEEATEFGKSVLLCEAMSSAVRKMEVEQILAVLEKLDPKDRLTGIRYAFGEYVRSGNFDTAKRLLRILDEQSDRSGATFDLALQYASGDLEGCLAWIEKDLKRGSRERRAAFSGIVSELRRTSDIRRLPDIFPLIEDDVTRRDAVVYIVNGLPQLGETEKLTEFIATLKGEELELANLRLEWVKNKSFWSKFDKGTGKFRER